MWDNPNPCLKKTIEAYERHLGMLEKFKDNHDQKDSFEMFLTSTVNFLAQKTNKSLAWC